MVLLEFEGERVVVEMEMGKEGNERENESEERDGDDDRSWFCRSLVSQQSDADGDDAQPTQLVIISTFFFFFFSPLP